MDNGLYMRYPRHVPAVFVIRSLMSVEPRPNICTSSMDNEKRKPVKAVLFIWLYFLYSRGRKQPNGTKKKIFKMVSMGPLIMSKKGISTILGEKALNLPIPVIVRIPIR